LFPCSTRRIESMKEEMCWSPMWAWSTKYANGLSGSLYYVQQDHPFMTFILSNIHPKDGLGCYTSKQRNFLVNYRYERCFPFPGHRVPTTHYTHLYGFIQWRVTHADPPYPHLLSPHLRCNPLVGFCRCHRRHLQQPSVDTSIHHRNQRYASASMLQWIPQSAAKFLEWH
jgi:hypothetical protein